MLNSASDYKFLDVSNVSGMIHGNIMPVASPNANAMARIRFEDYLFLLEAYHERANVTQAGSRDVSIPPRTIYSSNIIATELNVSGVNTQYEMMYIPNRISQSHDYPRYISPNTTVIQTPLLVSSSAAGVYVPTYNGVFTNFTNVKVTNRNPYLSKRPLRSQYVMWSEYIRAAHYQMNNCTKMWLNADTDAFLTSATTNYYDSDGNITGQSPMGIDYRSTGYYRINGNGTVSTGPKKSVDVETVYKSSYGTFPYATSAVALVWCRALENSASTMMYYCVPVHLTVANGDVQIPQQLFQDAAAQAAAQIGKTVSNVYEVFAGPVDVVIDFEFPARLNGVHWNWNPQYTS